MKALLLAFAALLGGCYSATGVSSHAYGDYHETSWCYETSYVGIVDENGEPAKYIECKSVGGYDSSPTFYKGFSNYQIRGY